VPERGPAIIFDDDAIDATYIFTGQIIRDTGVGVANIGIDCG
jgi:hypothetical protein